MSLAIKREGDPRLVTGPGVGTVNGPTQYKVATTPLPQDGPRTTNWLGFFNDQLKGPLSALHDGVEVTVYCEPSKEPNWLALVDAAIEIANEKERTVSYTGDV